MKQVSVARVQVSALHVDPGLRNFQWPPFFDLFYFDFSCRLSLLFWGAASLLCARQIFDGSRIEGASLHGDHGMLQDSHPIAQRWWLAACQAARRAIGRANGRIAG
jgi:hypothetical protein